MSKTLQIGLIGLDTSHVSAFTKLLNDPDAEYHVPGGKVTVAYPGGSSDLELSYSRVDGFTNELHEQYGIQIVDSLEAVAEQSDAIMLESVDGRVHLNQFMQIAPFGKPVFIDKPFALSTAEADSIFELATQYNVPLMSCSSLRYAEGLVQVLSQQENGPIYGADFYGPMEIQPTQPGFFWYGIHTVEMLFAAMGAGCEHVTVTTNDKQDVAVGVWNDGRIGTIRGNRHGNRLFGGLIHRDKATQEVDVYAHRKPYYASLLEIALAMFRTGKPPIDRNETRQIIRFIEAANESRVTGKMVNL
ncbi:Gfo/Idh/MocA family protein [Paenibacillus solisilvae]|uniref:Gfo/Idh/MocA family protein n=1 Tax=Paenibacillus solisilvae TaxID=2486751 RepID=A0ABW0VRI3_9BACL